MEQLSRTDSPQAKSKGWSVASIAGALVSAFLASLCCLGPLLLALLGLGGAGLLVKFERYRPYFMVLTLALLGLGFYFTYRKPKLKATPAAGTPAGAACECEHPKANRLGKVALWVATVFVVGFLAFPYLAAALAR